MSVCGQWAVRWFLSLLGLFALSCTTPATPKRVASDTPIDVAPRIWEPSSVGIVRDKNLSGLTVALRALDARVRIQGRRVQTTLSHQISTSHAGPVRFVFPLPQGASLHSVRLGDAVLTPGRNDITARFDPNVWLGDRTLDTTLYLKRGSSTISVVYTQLLETVGTRGTYTLPLTTLPRKTELPLSFSLTSSLPLLPSRNNAYRMTMASSPEKASWLAQYQGDVRGPLRLDVEVPANHTHTSQRFFHHDITTPTHIHRRKKASHYLLALDTSSGHGDTFTQNMAHMAWLLIDGAPEGTTFGVITGATYPRVCGINLDAAQARACIKNPRGLGGSNLDGLLQVASEQAVKMSASSKPVEVFLLSDGLATFGELRRSRLMTRVRQGFSDKNLSLHTIATGFTAATEELSHWATLGGGAAFRMTPHDTPRVFAAHVLDRIQQQGVRRLRARVVSGDVSSLALESRAWNAPGQRLGLFGILKSERAEVVVSGIHPDGSLWSTRLKLQHTHTQKTEYHDDIVLHWALATRTQLELLGAFALKQAHLVNHLKAYPFEMVRAWRAAQRARRQGNLTLHPERRPVTLASLPSEFGRTRTIRKPVCGNTHSRAHVLSFYKVRTQGCSQADMEKFFQQKATAFQFCYERGNQGRHREAGETHLTFSLYKRGRAVDPKLTAQNPDRRWRHINACIQRVTSDLQFQSLPKACKVSVSMGFENVKHNKDDGTRVREWMRHRVLSLDGHAAILETLLRRKEPKRARQWLSRLLQQPNMLSLQLFRSSLVRDAFPEEYKRAVLQNLSSHTSPSLEDVNVLTNTFSQQPLVIARALAPLSKLSWEGMLWGLLNVSDDKQAFSKLWAAWSPRLTHEHRNDFLNSVVGFHLRKRRTVPPHVRTVLRKDLAALVSAGTGVGSSTRQWLVTMSHQMNHPETLQLLDELCKTGHQELSWCLTLLEEQNLSASRKKEISSVWIQHREPVIQQNTHYGFHTELALISLYQGNEAHGRDMLTNLIEKDFKEPLHNTEVLNHIDPIFACQLHLTYLQRRPHDVRTFKAIEHLRAQHPGLGQALEMCQVRAAASMGRHFDRIILILRERPHDDIRILRAPFMASLTFEDDTILFGTAQSGDSERDNTLVLERGKTEEVRGKVIVLEGIWRGEPRTTHKTFHLSQKNPSAEIKLR